MQQGKKKKKKKALQMTDSIPLFSKERGNRRLFPTIRIDDYNSEKSQWWKIGPIHLHKVLLPGFCDGMGSNKYRPDFLSIDMKNPFYLIITTYYNNDDYCLEEIN